MNTLTTLSKHELCCTLSAIFDSKRPIEEKDLCEILQNGADANGYEIGNANTRFTIEFRKNGQTHKFYIVELADYDEETEEYNTIGYLIESEK